MNVSTVAIEDLTHQFDVQCSSAEVALHAKITTNARASSLAKIEKSAYDG